MLEVLLLSIALILALVVLVMAFFHMFTSVPFVPSKAKVITKMVQLAKVQPGDTVYDLGAGDARILTTAKQVQPQCTAVGYEILPAAYLQGLLRIWWLKLNVTLRFQSFHKADLTKATIIFCYLIPKEMQRLEQKFSNELQFGTRVFSSMFPLPNTKPVAVHEFFTGKRKRTIYEYCY